MNGAGLEDFMDDALAASEGAVIDCSAGLELLPAMGHEGHDHDTEYDPHIWMDPGYAQDMMAVIAQGLGEALYGDDWASHGEFHTNQLVAKDVLEQARQRWAEQLVPPGRGGADHLPRRLPVLRPGHRPGPAEGHRGGGGSRGQRL